MQVSLSTGNYSIISSGQAFLFGEDKDLKITIVSDNGFKFYITLVFEKDDTKEQRVTKTIKEDAITLVCFNFREMGTGLSKPISIARVAGKEVLLMFWSYVEGEHEKVRSVKYTIFLNNSIGDDISEG